MLVSFRRLTRPVRALGRATTFLFKLFPMLPSRPIDWVTQPPVVQKVTYPTCTGEATGDLYRPASPGPHPGILVCLGVVPFGVDHPQVPVLGKALARAGFAALLYWSPHMRDFRLDPEDVENIPLAYHWLMEQEYIDPARSGLLGTCVGGSFALMSAASPLIRDEVAFICAYAPFSSMLTFARDIASATRSGDDGRQPWKVDQLTRKVFVHSVTATLDAQEAQQLQTAFSTVIEVGHVDPDGLSVDGKAVYSLLITPDAEQAEAGLHRLPAGMHQRLEALSPVNYLQDIHAPLIVLLHDRGDQVIPVGESRRLISAFANRPGLHFTEMQFSHLDPTKGRLPIPVLARELGKFFLAVYPMFRQSVEA